MPTYISVRNQAGRVAVIRLNPAWTVAARLHGGAPAAPPRIDARHWGVEAIVWELQGNKRRYDPHNAEAVFARAQVLAKLLTDGGMTEAQVADLPLALPYKWAIPRIVSGYRGGVAYAPCFYLETPSQPGATP